MLKTISLMFALSKIVSMDDSKAMEFIDPHMVGDITPNIKQLALHEDNDKTRDIIFSDASESNTTEVEINQPLKNVPSKKLSYIEIENVHKMMLMRQGLNQGFNEGKVPEVPSDVINVISLILHKLTANSVIDGELIYTRPRDGGQQCAIKINELVKEGTVDLSRSQFANTANHLVITIDPIRFFQIEGENKNKVVMLFARRSLIEAHLSNITKEFATIIDFWEEDHAPIGIFWRWGNWSCLNWFDYLTTFSTEQISQKNLLELWMDANHKDIPYMPRLLLQTPDFPHFTFKLKP